MKAKYFVVSTFNGHVHYSNTLEDAKNLCAEVSSEIYPACIFKNTPKGQEQAKRYARKYGWITLYF